MIVNLKLCTGQICFKRLELIKDIFRQVTTLPTYQILTKEVYDGCILERKRTAEENLSGIIEMMNR